MTKVETKALEKYPVKIKVTNPACMAYKEGKNYWEKIKERKEK